MISRADRIDACRTALLPTSNLADRCSVSTADPTGWIGRWFAERECFCTRLFHCDGVHVARAMDGKILYVWEEK